ncbi:MAG: hypothetical protein M3015_13785 [Bacteroidota bacterium]|nr:hypothetical protein [Bacteroidota bacterium]
MRKILFSTLLLFFYCESFAQNIPAKEKTAAVPDNETSNASFKQASVLKVNVLAPLLGYSQFSLEKSVGHLRSIEFGLGIIGAGKNLNIQPHSIGLTLDRFGPYNYRPGHKNQFGGFFEFGYKFIKPFHSKKISQNNYSAVNTFEGAYIKPSFIIGAYSFSQFSDDSTTATIRKHHRFGALMLNLGHQWTVSGKIVFELYMGGGAEIDNVKDEDLLYGHPFVLAVAKDNPSVNFAFTAGFRFGFLFK